MKKRAIFFLFFITLFMNINFAAKRPVIYVAALSGLIMREAPGKRAPKIQLLPYGTRISNYNLTHDWDTVDGYKGSWLRVALNGKDGYIFGGYTIPIEPPTADCGSMFTYLQKVLGSLVSKDSVIRNEGDLVKTYVFKKMVLYQQSFDYVSEYSIVNLNMSVQEGYLLMYLLEHFNRDIWDSGYRDEKSEHTLNPGFPGKNDNNLYRSEANVLIYENDFSLNIFRIHSGIVITWTCYP